MSHSTFLSAYTTELHISVADNPERYIRALENFTIEELAETMVNAAASGKANVTSPTFERTCARLGIKHNYPAILDFLSQNEAPKSPVESPDTELQPSTI